MYPDTEGGGGGGGGGESLMCMHKQFSESVIILNLFIKVLNLI